MELPDVPKGYSLLVRNWRLPKTPSRQISHFRNRHVRFAGDWGPQVSFQLCTVHSFAIFTTETLNVTSASNPSVLFGEYPTRSQERGHTALLMPTCNTGTPGRGQSGRRSSPPSLSWMMKGTSTWETHSSAYCTIPGMYVVTDLGFSFPYNNHTPVGRFGCTNNYGVSEEYVVYTPREPELSEG